MLTTLLRRPEKRATKHAGIPPRDPALAALWGWGNETDSGISVSEDTAVRFSAVYACVRIISETVASLPIKVYERNPGGGKTEVSSHPLAWMLNYGEPNPDQTPMVFREQLSSHVLLSGNTFAEISYNARGEVGELRVRQPDRVIVDRDRTGRLSYTVIYDDGSSGVIDAADMLHVPGMGGDGICGWSPVRLFRESIGVGLAAERMASRVYGKSARPSMVVVPAARMTPEDKKRFEQDLNENYSGEKAFSAMVMPPAVDVKTISMPLTDAQFIESRKFQIQDIARIYRVPPHMLADLERATHSNIEHQALEFEKHCIRPWLVRHEQEYNRKLFSARQRGRMFLEHSAEGLLRGDIKSRFEAYQIAFMNGWVNRDEIRGKENMEPTGDEAGKAFFVPANLIPADRALDMPVPEDDPIVPDSADDDQDDDARSLFLSHIVEGVASSLVGVEATRATRAAKNPGKFLTWLDEFYVDHRDKMAERFGPQHGDVIDSHIQRSRLELLEAAGRATRDELPAAIDAVIASWNERAGELADAILKGVCDA